MRLRRLLFLTALVSVALCLGSVRASDDADDAKDALREKGIRVSTSSLSLSDESKLSKTLRDISQIRKKLMDHAKILPAAERQLAENKAAITRGTRLNGQLNAQLATINPNNIALNNKLVGAISANESKMRLLAEQQERMDEQLKAMRRSVNATREEYIQYVLDMREMADGIEQQYATLAADADVQAALKKLNAASDKTFKLEPSRSFQSSLKKLKGIQDSVLSEKIPLRTEGNSFYVSVVINGKHTQEMVVDSGASIISLPHQVAVACGIEPKDSDPTIQLVIADGSVIHGKAKTIKSVRVGKFTVEDVECAVLGLEATHATPLLGMSFLGQFKFELDAQAKTLTMAKVDTGSSTSTSRRRTRRK